MSNAVLFFFVAETKKKKKSDFSSNHTAHIQLKKRKKKKKKHPGFSFSTTHHTQEPISEQTNTSPIKRGMITIVSLHKTIGGRYYTRLFNLKKNRRKKKRE
jgi:hypothetical protein